MYNHRGTLAHKYDSQDSYACNQYSKYPHKCTMHYIKTSAVRKLVLEAIKSVSDYVRDNQDEFVKIVREENELRHENNAKTRKKQLEKSQKRYDELDVIIKRLFEEKVAGTITEKRFEILSREYENEQEELERSIAELRAGIEQYQADGEKADKFINLVKKYTDFSELTPEMLNEFIEKIVVFEAEKINGRVRKQKVDIHLNFIGKFTLPNQAEQEEEHYDPVEAKRAKWREYYYKDREKTLAKKREATAKRQAEKRAELNARPPEIIAAEQQAKKEKSRAYHQEYARKWREKNRDKVRESNKKHRDKIRAEREKETA